MNLAGSTISRATLNNLDYIVSKGITIGSTVIIEKGGEVIPKVTGVVEPLNEKVDLFKIFPTTKDGKNLLCPCGLNQPLVQYPGKIDYFCEYPNCPEQQLNKILHFASRNAMDIEGLGEKVTQELIEEKFIKNIGDIYFLKNYRTKLEILDGWGEQSVDNLLKSIEESKSKSFDRVLYAIGIPGVGKETAKLLAKKFHNIENLKKATVDDLLSIPSIGKISALSIYQFFKNKKIIELCNQLEKVGLQLKEQEEKENDNNSKQNSKKISEEFKKMFYGKICVITGTFSSMKREEIKELVEQAGGKVVGTISSKTNYLLLGNNAGNSKLEKANQYNLSIIEEKLFIDLLKI